MKNKNNTRQTKAAKIIYWIATIWLSLGMAVTGTVQLFRLPDDVALMDRLGYPVYLLTILGIWKLLGVITILVSGFRLLKEWAYAGFFFAMSGAIFSHMASGSTAIDYFGPGLLLVLTLLSWYFRPAVRRISQTEKTLNPAEASVVRS